MPPRSLRLTDRILFLSQALARVSFLDYQLPPIKTILSDEHLSKTEMRLMGVVMVWVYDPQLTIDEANFHIAAPTSLILDGNRSQVERHVAVCAQTDTILSIPLLPPCN